MSKNEQKKREKAQVVEYRPSLVCFIDILGFSALLKNMSANEVHKVLSRLRETTEPSDHYNISDKEISQPHWFQVSDAIVRVRHYDTAYRDGALFHELFDLGIAQANLAQSGVFIRGGLAIGDASTGKKGSGPAFGPAFVKAYEIESVMAVYPRISISHTVIEEYRNGPRLKAETNDSGQDEDYVLPMVRNSSTGPWIDYMAVIQQNEEPNEHVDFCSRHAEQIRERLTKFGDNPAIMKKFLWLAAYHNQHIEPFLEDPNGEHAEKWIAQFGFDGVKVFRSAKIDAPYGWSMPNVL